MSKNRWIVIGGIALLVLILAGLGLQYYLDRKTREPAPELSEYKGQYWSAKLEESGGTKILTAISSSKKEVSLAFREGRMFELCFRAPGAQAFKCANPEKYVFELQLKQFFNSNKKTFTFKQWSNTVDYTLMNAGRIFREDGYRNDERR